MMLSKKPSILTRHLDKMTAKFQQFKEYIKSLELDLSDLLLAIGFVFSVPFYAFAWKFMVTPNPAEILFKNWMMIICFACTAICWTEYFYLEIKKGRLKNNAFLWVYVFLTILGFIGVLVQPKTISNVIEVKHVNDITKQYYGEVALGDMVNVSYTITPSHRLFFAFATLIIPTIYYIILMVLPKRIKDLYFVVFCGICVALFVLVITCYSYIAEAHKYPLLLQAFFKGDMHAVYDKYSIESFLTHRVPYGVSIMLGIIFGLLLHSITKKWYWFILVGYSYINLLLTWCKTAIALSTLAIAFYLVLLLIESFKEHRKRNLILSIIYCSVVGLGLLVVLVSIITKGAVVAPAYKVFQSFTDGRTIKSRTFIWDNIRTLLSGGWIWIGRGFGTYNSMLFPMNILNGDLVCPSHSSYYAVLGQGGIFTLIGFLGSLIYFGFIFFKCFKVNKIMTLKLSIGVFTYFLYTFTEGINYIIVVFMFPTILYYWLIQRGLVSQESK